MTKLIDKAIKINRKHGGKILNKSNLDFDLEQAELQRSVFRKNAYIIRGIVAGHPFIDANKRTAITLITRNFAAAKIKYNKKKVLRGIVLIAKNNIQDINKIEKMQRRWK